jgi:hypothetical protein
MRVTKVLGVLGFTALLLAATVPAQAVVDIIPNSALIPSTTYYTDLIGGGIGAVVVTNGGGSAANVGLATGRNDDGFQQNISLGFSLPFFGNTYTVFSANNNGNITLGPNSGLAAFTPSGPQGATQPIISPFFADVDTRGALSGVMHLRTDIANEIIVTWDNVGYFDSHDDKLNAFQLVVRGPGFTVPAGEGNIGFFYKGMTWETGDASGGSGGFGGNPAAVGFGDGNQNGKVLQGSLQNGISGIVQNHHIWFDLSLAPVPPPDGGPTPPPAGVPEPTTLALLGSGLVGLALRRYRRPKSSGV